MYYLILSDGVGDIVFYPILWDAWGVGYFVKDAIEVRDREKMSAMLCRLLANCSWMMMMMVN